MAKTKEEGAKEQPESAQASVEITEVETQDQADALAKSKPVRPDGVSRAYVSQDKNVWWAQDESTAREYVARRGQKLFEVIL